MQKIPQKTEPGGIQKVRPRKPTGSTNSPLPASEITSEFGSAGSRITSLALWFLALGAIARITVFVRPRAASEFSNVDVLAGVQILLIILMLVIVLLSGRAAKIWLSTSGTSMRAFYYYYFFCVISMVWSALPIYSLYRASEVIILLSGVLVALSYAKDLLRAERTVFIVSFFTAIFSIFMSLKLHDYSISIKILHSTAYPAAAAMVFCYCLGEYFSADKRRKKSLKWVGMIALAATMLGTSAGSIVAATVGVLLIALLHRNTTLIVVGCLVLFVLFVFTQVFPLDGFSVKDINLDAQTEKRLMTLSGRLPMWIMFLDYVYESPIVGYGFALLTKGKGQVFNVNPHNSFFSIVLGSGFLGLSIVVVYLIRLLRESLQTTRQKLPGAVGCSAAIFCGIINSITAPAIFDIVKPATLVFTCYISLCFLFVVLPYLKQKKAVRENISATRRKIRIG